MAKLTAKEQEIIDILKHNPFLEQEEIAKQLEISRSAVAGHLARLVKKGIIQRGYILNKKTESVAVIGGANVDIKGVSDDHLREGSSNPGTVFKTAGGVGRNVAENLARLEVPISFYSTVGMDTEGDWLLELTKSAGVDVKFVERRPEENTGRYLSILNSQKEQVASIADMRVMDKMDEAFLKKIYPSLTQMKFVFVDTNLPTESLQELLAFLKEKKIPILIDPVSAKKATKLIGNLDGVWLFTPNKEEAEVITGLSINSDQELEKVANALLDLGIQQLVITLGSEGVFIATDKEKQFLPSPKVDVKDTTGAGDAFIAGVIYGLFQDKSLVEACLYGHAMAGITLEREETVASDLTVELIEFKKKEL